MPVPSLFRIDADLLPAWGAFIKTLATGYDHLNGPVHNEEGELIARTIAEAYPGSKLEAAYNALQARHEAESSQGEAAIWSVPPLLRRSEVVAILAELGLDRIALPTDCDWVDFNQDRSRILTVRLPCAPILLAQERSIAMSGGYRLPDHVVDWMSSLLAGHVANREQQYDFNTTRVGEYSIQHCE